MQRRPVGQEGIQFMVCNHLEQVGPARTPLTTRSLDPPVYLSSAVQGIRQRIPVNIEVRRVKDLPYMIVNAEKRLVIPTCRFLQSFNIEPGSSESRFIQYGKQQLLTSVRRQHLVSENVRIQVVVQRPGSIGITLCVFSHKIAWRAANPGCPIFGLLPGLGHVTKYPVFELVLFL